MRCTLVVALFALATLMPAAPAAAQIDARLFRHADVSDTQIAFVYGGDIWLVDRDGGTAAQVTRSPGEESWPKFSPDGSRLAYTASYDGNPDVYVMPTSGGVPTRVTYSSFPDRMVDWHPDGERVLFASGRQSGRGPSQLFLVSADGGFPEKLPVPYGELGSFSPDGRRLAYITKITEDYPFKRYEGGLSSDVIIADLEAESFERVTDYVGTDGKPAWAGDRVYVVSDRGPEVRLNVWSYDPATGEMEQLTDFADFDISLMSAGDDELVFAAGGRLYLMALATGEYGPVDIDVVSDLAAEMPREVDVSDRIRNMTASPGGKRVVFEARGELFDVPASEGYVENLTQSSGAFDRAPAWSPDGRRVAFWSDRTGENEVWLRDVRTGAERQLTDRGEGYGYTLYWSPDSEKLAFIDERNDIRVIEIESGDVEVAGNYRWNVSHPGRQSYPIAWSPDSRWLAFTEGQANANDAIILYDVEAAEAHQVTSGYYSDSNPVFSRDGRYLFFLTDRQLDAAYSSLGDGTWIYPNSTRLAAIGLTPDVPSPLEPRNDEVPAGDETARGPDGPPPSGEDDNGDGPRAAGDAARGGGPPGEGTASGDEPAAVTIDLEDFESRLVLLPPDAGNLGGLMPFDGKIAYLRAPNTGAEDGPPNLVLYDLEAREEQTVAEAVVAAVPSADGKMILVSQRGRYGLIRPAAGQNVEEPIPTDGLVMDLVPREEWEQIFHDTWRRHRDMFYDPNMHGVDWDALRDRYGALLDHARTRWDVSFLQSQLASELSAGHTYTFGGDTEPVETAETGFLGIDWTLDDAGYRIDRIVRPAPWDTETRSPLDRPGLDIREGDYVLAVNGQPLDTTRDPYAAFEGLAGETVSLRISRTGDPADARTIVVETLTTGGERNLRYLEWIESNRRMVDELSDGALGYVYMSNTAAQGQRELVRMYYGQLDRKGFIIDERFNGGGQLADRFLELMQRPVVYNLHWRHGRDHTYPIKANTGPMGMLINGWAGSGGDGLPWAFQELEAGPIVGERTLGILVGPATGHQLIDGGGITVPGARLYDNDGHWFWEGEGVAPDIPVWDDPNLLIQGRDPQIERVVEEVMKSVGPDSNEMTPAPPLEDRSGRGGPGG
ncbi:MAG: S41 family peptidase [Candidatus Longimicrobiales bacterium M2_2A_002]